MPVAALAGYTQFQWDRINLAAIVIFSVVSCGVLVFIRIIEYCERSFAKKVVEIDYDTGVAIFYNYSFITRFSGNKRTAMERVPMVGIYKTKSIWNNGNEFLEITTEKGLVTLVNLEKMDEVREAFSEITRTNEELNPDFHHKIESAPKPKTPWYGWAIILGAVGLVIYVGWLTMYSR